MQGTLTSVLPLRTLPVNTRTIPIANGLGPIAKVNRRGRHITRGHIHRHLSLPPLTSLRAPPISIPGSESVKAPVCARAGGLQARLHRASPPDLLLSPTPPTHGSKVALWRPRPSVARLQLHVSHSGFQYQFHTFMTEHRATGANRNMFSVCDPLMNRRLLLPARLPCGSAESPYTQK